MNFVKSVIDAWDPIGLFSHAPDDEYHSEIEEIERLLSVMNESNELASGIYKIFVESFGADIFVKSYEECKQIAHMLLKEQDQVNR